MGWRYKAGLFLILTVIITWVTCAEVTQGIFEDYEHPFALAYLGTSLLVLFLPIAFIKDGLFYLFRSQSRGSDKITQITNVPSGRLESPVMVDGVNGVSELDCNGYGQENGMELKSQEEGMAIDIDVVEELKKDKSELNHKEMARLGFLIAPVWFITEYLTNAALARTSVSSTMLGWCCHDSTWEDLVYRSNSCEQIHVELGSTRWWEISVRFSQPSPMHCFVCFLKSLREKKEKE